MLFIVKQPIIVPKRVAGVDRHEWSAPIRIAVRDELTGHVKLLKTRNVITSVGKDYLASMLGNQNTIGITYVAFGTSNTAVSSADTQLGAEVFRKQVTKQPTQVAASNNQTTTVYVATFELIGTAIAEIGWFAGPNASATANSGVLIGHVLYSHTKLSTESLQIDRTDQF